MNTTPAASVALTKTQVDALRYYRALADKDREALKSLRSPDPRPVSKLLDLKLLDVIGYNYGPLYGITAAGRAELKRLGF